MDFLHLCKERFSARKYTAEQVSQQDLEYIKEAVRMAPSAVNKQPYKFVIVQSEEERGRLQQCYDRDWFKSAPLYIIGYKSDEASWVRQYDRKPHADIDVAIATEHLCLAATAQGLGTCWVCNFDTGKLRELFPLAGYEAAVIVTIGHIASDCPHPEKKRKSMEDLFETI
ncbi:nitroreductase family protein [Prevotella sp. KH2C16]|uniref:nitroreductase family protein n=1 Tax=Prevotella sp. KH2C16 TaxID=1855325 RepID=UPI0008EAB962|nr:nitroreductase family protein [Prevotella sp. KH2C16]SFG52846.1 Nitroreductase [Prevotella sp. KH2C16]